MKKLRVYKFSRKSNGKVTEFKAETCLDGPFHYALIKSGGTLRHDALVLMKNKWVIELGEEMEIKKVEEPKTESPHVEEPPAPAPEPQDDMELSDEEIATLESAVVPGGGGVTGDLTKNIGPREYNVWANTQKIGAKELMSMRAHVESNYALQEGERKIQQARAKRMMNEMVERRGVGFIPE